MLREEIKENGATDIPSALKGQIPGGGKKHVFIAPMHLENRNRILLPYCQMKIFIRQPSLIFLHLCICQLLAS